MDEQDQPQNNGFAPYQPRGPVRQALGQLPPVPGPQQPQQQVIPPPFTQGDSLYLQRLQAGIAKANEDLDAGNLSAQDHQQFLQMVMPKVSSLQTRQKQVQAEAQQAAKAAAMDATATQEAIKGLNLKLASEQLPGQVAHLTDPLTGESEMMVPEMDAHGAIKWKPVEMKRSQAEKDRLQTAPSDRGPSSQGELQKLDRNILYNLQDQAPTGAPQPVQSFQEFGQQQRQQAGGAPLPRILNASGQDITEQQQQAFDRFQRTGSWAPETTGKQIGLSGAQIKELYRRAEQHVPQVDQNNPHLVLARRHALDQFVQQAAEHHLLTERQNHAAELNKTNYEEKSKQQAEEYDRRIKQMTKELEERYKTHLAQAEGKNLTAKEKSSIMQHYEDRADKEVEKFKADILNKDKTHPLEDLDAREKWISEKFNKHMARLGQGGATTPVADNKPPPENKPAPAPENKPPPIKPKEPEAPPERNLVSKVGDVVQNPVQELITKPLAEAARQAQMSGLHSTATNPQTGKRYDTTTPLIPEMDMSLETARKPSKIPEERVKELYKRVHTAYTDMHPIEKIRGFGPALARLDRILGRRHEEGGPMSQGEAWWYMRELTKLMDEHKIGNDILP